MRHDAADDFDYPAMPEGHPLRPHVLYRLDSSAYFGVRCAYEAAAPTACFRAGGVQRKAAPNLFQTLIDATADVR